jgi:uncharacterized protein (UPF0548 family)
VPDRSSGPGRTPVTELSPAATEQLRRADLTYPDIGATRDQSTPPGYHGLHVARTVGTGRADFDRAVDALLCWRMHPRAGVQVTAASDPRIAEGTVAVLRLGLGRLGLSAPVRVVYVVEEPDRQGFAYGTLAGHPEAGEEAFVVTHRADGAVVFEVTAFSRGASRLTRLGGPLARVAQRLVAQRYLRALGACVRRS